MRRTAFLSAAAVLLIGGSAFAQAKPNFAGKWVILPDSTGPAQQQGIPRGGAAMGGLSEEALIEQDDKMLSIYRQLNFGPTKTVFTLDGSETRQSLDIGNGNMVDLTLTAKWDGAKLHCSTWVNLQGQGFEIVLNLSLDEKGNLVSEHITPAMGNNNPGGTEVTKYKKAP